MVAGGGAAAGAVLLLAAAAFFFYRRSKGSNKKQAARGGDIELGDVELEEGDDRSTMLARHKDTSMVVQHGLSVPSTRPVARHHADTLPSRQFGRLQMSRVAATDSGACPQKTSTRRLS